MRLTPKALALLSFMAGRPGEVITKEELFAAVWPEVAVGDAALVHASRRFESALATMPGSLAISRRCTAAVTGSSGKAGGPAPGRP